MRARVVYASKERVQQNAITYEELADPKWKGKICIRSGQHMYNNALFAAMIAKHGEAKAEEWLKGLKANLAQKPSGGDRETARDIAAGKCDLGIGNTYYWALMNDQEADRKPWAEATKVILPTFQGGGTHVNVSGVALIKTAPNKANAMKFIEWMVEPAAQQMHADVTYEYPMRAGVPINKTIASYGELKRDPMPLAQIAANRKKASATGRQGRLRQLTKPSVRCKSAIVPAARRGRLFADDRRGAASAHRAAAACGAFRIRSRPLSCSASPRWCSRRWSACC